MSNLKYEVNGSRNISFDDFQAMNARRCEEAFNHRLDPAGSWPFQNWALAIAGESGELCNLVKKILRGDLTFAQALPDIRKELADIICYADLAMSCISANTGEEVLAKFDEVSKRKGWKKE